MFLTFELDLEMINMIQLVKHLGQRSFSSNVIVRMHTDTHMPYRTDC